MRPFRFGVGVWHVASRAELADKARKVEALGYDTLSFPDHLTDRIAPMPAVMTAAEATTRLRIGTNVLNNDLRHPVLVAREAAAVDLLSDGRLQLGLGAGSIKSEYDEAGFGFDPGRVRGGRPRSTSGSNWCVRPHAIDIPSRSSMRWCSAWW